MMIHLPKRILVLLTLATFLSGCANFANTATLTKARQQANNQAYPEALKLVAQSEGMRGIPTEGRLSMVFLKAEIHERQGDRDTAVALYLFLCERHTDSQYGYLARQKLRSLAVKPDSVSGKSG